ncbi:MAG: histidine ammonia-lyase [Candidatus Berkiella sp.]
MMEQLIVKAGQLSLADLKKIYTTDCQLSLDEASKSAVLAANKVVNDYVTSGKMAYGINTGFGKLANVMIPEQKLSQLQRNLVLSHACGVGALIDSPTVRMILLLKINALMQGFSGVSWELIERLTTFFNTPIYPCIPVKGSVGASGDLAPLAHVALAVIGEGDVLYQDKVQSAKAVLQKVGLNSFSLSPKEGLALLNGTQVSTALLLRAMIRAEQLIDATIVAGALSMSATQADLHPLDHRIHDLRGLTGQTEIANILSLLLGKDSKENKGLTTVQDPYSLRCQPQVLGACVMQMRYVSSVLHAEINAVTDNPLVFAKTHEIISGGNFHAQAIALAADSLATAIATIATIAERRIALLLDPQFSRLPAFLVEASGENSGFMIAQVTAAALTSENKVLAHPASVDSIPTSMNQEDHVSMATFAARRLDEMIDNSMTVVAIELLAACQGLDLLKQKPATLHLKKFYDKIRAVVPFYDVDRYFAPDITKVKGMIEMREFALPKQVSNRCLVF